MKEDQIATFVPAGASPGSARIPVLGVVIVSYNSGPSLLECLESLIASTGVTLHIVVVDNASTDDSVARLRAWASGAEPWANPGDLPFALAQAPKPVRLIEADAPLPAAPAPAITLLHAGINGGYAAGVNAGLASLARTEGIGRFWILNPDSAVPAGTPRSFATFQPPCGAFSLMGGRVNYLETPDVIQIDGGIVNWKTGMTINVNQGASHRASLPPDPAKMDFITGASMVVSREFYEAAGPMTEDYFLYYEEVDWAMKRGDLPLAYCAEGLVYHRAGTSIGSPTLDRIASPLSLYFKHRNRLRFLMRHRRRSILTAHLFTLAKSLQTLLKGYRHEAWVMFSASFGASPTADVASRVSPQALGRAFGTGG
ncbi:MAG: glycosyltransferase family 2 protein [Paracoccaceae bacterium]